MTSVKLPVNALPSVVVAGTMVSTGSGAASAKKKKAKQEKTRISRSVDRAWGLWGGLTLFGQALAWRDGADIGEGDGHEGGGSEG